jgi:hypothetical protein
MQKQWKLVIFLFFVSFFLFACTPPDESITPPPPQNTAPTLSQPSAVSIFHNTLAIPEEKTVTFVVSDKEDAVAKLQVSASVKVEDANSVTLATPTCNEAGECALLLTIERTQVKTVTVALTVTDSANATASSTFNVVIAPEEKNVADGAELKTLLETAVPGSSFRLMNTRPILLGTQILLEQELTLFGLGQAQTILDAQTLDRHFWIKPMVKITLHDLTLTNGNAQDAGTSPEGDRVGGAIFNEGLLTLNGVRIINSRAVKGGGVYTYRGETRVLKSVIGQENNSNIATNSGGGLFNDDGKLEVTESQVSFNRGVLRGGGIFNFRTGELLVQSSTLFNNFSEDGTAIKNEEAVAIVRESTLENNAGTQLEGGAIVNLRGRLELYDSLLKNNETLVGSGGAIYNGATSAMLIDNTVLEGNKAARAGGAIYNEVNSGLLELRGGTRIISNSASRDGGGIYNAGTLKISSDCQITTNTANTPFRGGGIFNTGTFVETPVDVINQVVTNNQPDNVAEPPPGLKDFYKTLYQRR